MRKNNCLTCKHFHFLELKYEHNPNFTHYTTTLCPHLSIENGYTFNEENYPGINFDLEDWSAWVEAGPSTETCGGYEPESTTLSTDWEKLYNEQRKR